jgi:hypothetical protein
MKRLSTVLAVMVVVASFLGISTSAWAITTYSYTGNNFTTTVDSPSLSGVYTTSMHVSGWFEVASPIAGNASNLIITPTSYSFFDGRNTYTNANSVLDPSSSPFQVSTDGTGKIINWYIGVSRSGTGNLITWNNSPLAHEGNVSLVYDHGSVQPVLTSSNRDTGDVNNNPGVWTSNTTPTPIPGALLLFGSGLLGLVGIGRKRFKK